MPQFARRTGLSRLLGVALLYCTAATVGLAFRTEPEKFAIFWPPNGLLLGLLLVSVPRNRLVTLLAAFVVCVAANLFAGNSPAVTAGFTLVNLGEPCGAVWLFSRLRRGPLTLGSAAEVFVLFLGVLPVCAVAALVGAATVVFGLGAEDFGSVWLAFLLTDVLGIELVTPVVLAWAALVPRGRWRLAACGCVEMGLILVAGFTLSWLVFTAEQSDRPHLLSDPYPLFPLLLWAAFRFGARGATAAMLVLALVAIWHTGRGLGPFARPDVPVTLRLLMVQLFLSVLSLGSLALAASLADRRRAEDALRESELRYREVTETIREVFWVLTPDGTRLLYISPGYERVWGRTCASLYEHPSSFLDGVHPHDRDRVITALPKLTRGTYDEEFRIVRPDGVVRWVHARGFPLQDDRGEVVRIVGISLDVTDRKEAETAKAVLIEELKQALAEIKTLRGLIPICAWCKKIRDDAGLWLELERYLCQHTEAKFTHGVCPNCYSRFTEESGAGHTDS